MASKSANYQPPGPIVRYQAAASHVLMAGIVGGFIAVCCGEPASEGFVPLAGGAFILSAVAITNREAKR